MDSIELCAGAGGQALGLEQAGFHHSALLEIEPVACETLAFNRPKWNVLCQDIQTFSGTAFKGIDLVAGGVPCPPFSIAGKQLGGNDERDLFPEALRIISEAKPKAVMLENVRGLLNSIFDDYRQNVIKSLRKMGYIADWRLLNASDFGVPQLRPRVILVGIKRDCSDSFNWPSPNRNNPLTVGESLFDLMYANQWKGAFNWRATANSIAPTIVGGSKKHGGPDLGPTRSKRAWANLGVNGHSIADEAPEENFIGMPKLTNKMVARLQGFPDEWKICGKKTSAYRQIGNAFPPPVACAVGNSIYSAISANSKKSLRRV